MNQIFKYEFSGPVPNSLNYKVNKYLKRGDFETIHDGIFEVIEIQHSVNLHAGTCIIFCLKWVSKSPAYINFGDYVSIEQNRFGADNEHYEYAVISKIDSNSYVEVPVSGTEYEAHHEEIVPCVRCINIGVGNNDVHNFRIEDVKYLRSV